MTYRIWYKDDWHFLRMRDNTRSIVNFKTLDEACERVLVEDLAGAEVWKLVGRPKVSIERMET
jgi:hypothetical protein